MEDDVIDLAKVGMTSILIDRKEKYRNLPEGIKKIKSLLELKHMVYER